MVSKSRQLKQREAGEPNVRQNEYYSRKAETGRLYSDAALAEFGKFKWDSC